MENEWLIPESNEPLRQGDILICRDPSNLTISHASVILTADCDISKSKFGNYLACLRIVDFRSYIRNTWAKKKLDSSVRKNADSVKDQLNKWNARRTARASNLTIERSIEWIRNTTPEQICEDLKIPRSDQKRVITSLGKFKAAIEAHDSNSDKDSFTKLLAFNSKITGDDLSKCREAILKQARHETLPEDTFFLPALPQIDDRAAIVLLREIIAIPAHNVVFRTVDATKPDHYIRIGRLKSTFKYAISQSFGSLYSRIGLPESYEARRDSSMNDTFNSSWD